MKKNKKGMSEMWWIIAGAIIAILVVIFLVIWFKGSGEKGFDFLNRQFADSDNDGVTDALDKCPDNPHIKGELPEGVTSCT